MSMIKVENLTFSYPSSYDNIFEDVSFQIDTDWKLGFVGRNGRGKTTFLNLLMGEYAYRGKISASATFDYFPYPVPDPDKRTAEILTEVCPGAQQWQFLREFSLLEMNAETLDRPFSTLSGGERTKALLAALFLHEGHFLLIDEPTNHLDGNARQTVSDYLKRQKGFILVSHDRAFLDGCVDHILAINRADLQVESGNFSSWFLNFRRQQEFEAAQDQRLKSEIGRLQQAVKRTTAWSAYSEREKIGFDPVKTEKSVGRRPYLGVKSKKMAKRSKVIEKRRQDAIEEKSGLLKNVESAESLKLYPLSYRTDTLVSFEAVAPRYDGRSVCKPVTFSVHRGERVALDGGNGSGKSSLLKLLMGEPIPHSGKVVVGSGLVISYVPQDTSHLRGTASDFARAQHIEESLFNAMLRKLDLEKVQFEKRLEDFSGGQKKKVLIAASLCQQAHLYVWDEPLNYIDIYSRIQIEQLIRTFSPTMLFVEHDRAFRDALSTKILSL